MDQTRREALERRLREGEATIDALSRELSLPWTDVVDHLEHVRKSLHGPERLHMEPAMCLACGFAFRERTRLKTPSRCPECRSERIEPPRFRIG